MIFFLLLPASVAADPLDRWSAPIAEAAARFDLPTDWIRSVMRAESGGRTFSRGRRIVSPAGAMGLMQLMHPTWREMQALLGLGPNPFDPRDDILAGSAYLRLMYDRFGYPGLFFAYNAGPSRYAASLSSGRRLPTETRVYVTRILVHGAARGLSFPERGSEISPAGIAVGSSGVFPNNGKSLFVPLGRRKVE